MTDSERNKHAACIEDRAERDLASLERVTGHTLRTPSATCTESGDAILTDRCSPLRRAIRRLPERARAHRACSMDRARASDGRMGLDAAHRIPFA